MNQFFLAAIAAQIERLPPTPLGVSPSHAPTP